LAVRRVHDGQDKSATGHLFPVLREALRNDSFVLKKLCANNNDATEKIYTNAFASNEKTTASTCFFLSFFLSFFLKNQKMIIILRHCFDGAQNEGAR
jgi:hypothetical protein